MKRETILKVRIVILAAVVIFIILFGRTLLEMAMEAMVNSVNSQAESMMDQLLR